MLGGSALTLVALPARLRGGSCASDVLDNTD